MHPLLRPANLFVLTSYLLLSAVPFLSLFFGKSPSSLTRLLATEFVSWAFVWAIFKRPAWFHWLLLPAFIALPVELYLVAYYGQGISTHHLGIMVETSPKEAMEFLGYKVWLLGGILIGVLAWWGFCWRAAWRTRDLDWQDGSRWLALGFFVLAIFAWGYGEEVGYRPAASGSASASGEDSGEAADDAARRFKLLPEAWRSALPRMPHGLDHAFDTEEFAKSWPYGLALRVRDFWKERTYLADLKYKSADFSFGTRQVSAGDEEQIVVMVIGESSRYDRWSLNGYTRDTTPSLRKEANLVSLGDVITAVSATRLSVPVMVSRKPATQSLKAGFSEKSILTAFSEAGFKTFWLSNQMSFGQFDTPVSVFANEADVTQFLNLGGFTNRSNFDEVLLQPLQQALNDRARKKLIILHTLGNHWNYSHRHPPQYDRWKPSLYGVENPAYTDLRLKEAINNSYDNSMLYVDWFLDQVIGQLKDMKQMTSLMYVSDHGQTLYDDACNLAFHGHNTQYEFHVPAFVWLSERYKETFPAKVLQLQKNRNEKLSTENMFHTLLDMNDIRYPGEQLDRSFLSPQFKRHKRYVDSYGWTDYDHATIKGDCREIIDKGSPLTQEK